MLYKSKHPSPAWSFTIAQVLGTFGRKTKLVKLLYSSCLVHDRAVSLAASLHIVRVHTRCRPGGVAALVRLLAAVKVDVLEVKGVQVARDVSEKGQADVDKQVYAQEVAGQRGQRQEACNARRVMVNKCSTYPCHILRRPRLPPGGL